MAMYVFNKIIINGSKETILDFLNHGLSNCGIKPQDNIDKAHDLLIQKAFSIIPSYDNDSSSGIMTPTKEYGIFLGTFSPMDKLFLKFDTTSHRSKFPEIVSKQIKKFGVSGWRAYNYNCRFGCKWDSKIENLSVTSKNGQYTVSFCCRTANGSPLIWLMTVKLRFKLDVFVFSNLEFDGYSIYGEIFNLKLTYSNSDLSVCDKLLEDTIRDYYA